MDLSMISTNSIDKIHHMNCAYFWRDLETALSELKRVLKPGALEWVIDTKRD
ncbi:hypothetical protein T484DRAFT_1808464 [Baffinella frigidus]|nr:hypothetical protein T484DRAFT_1808464 [Cryptophyta sp. CCMP2293]